MRSRRHPWLCSYCGVSLDTKPFLPGGEPNRRMKTRQHIIPRRAGGRDTPDNLRPCCLGCNELLALAYECPALVACVRALVGGGSAASHQAMHRWLLVRVQRPERKLRERLRGNHFSKPVDT